MLVTALVASGPAEVPDVVAGLAARPPTGATARAALRVGREAFLDVVLLVGGRMDELHPAVDTGQRSVDVGHETFLSSGALPSASGAFGAATTADGTVRMRRRGRRRAIQVPLWSPCLGALGLDRCLDHTPMVRNGRCTRRNGWIACRDGRRHDCRA